MPDGEAPVSATRGVLLELKQERRLMQESYDFLDEKRILLAKEILQQLRRYQALLSDFEAAAAVAARTLQAAVRRHGLQGLLVYPAATIGADSLTRGSRNFLGLSLSEARLALDEQPPPPTARPSPEANVCREQARALLARAPDLAATARNIAVLSAEYTRTERRARALENILLPDIEADLMTIEEQLEAVEQEEALRVRNASER
jgi:V/A-type H+-transporting ATPase subunit D